jgi:D-2-hydroxyglutarate dehydrogenase
VLGLQVILADGRILNLNYPRTNLKDNTGYKIHQIFLGAEGTLGVITAVALLCPTYPVSQQSAWLACESFADVVQVLRVAKRVLGEGLAALEFMDATTVAILQRAPLRIPLVPETTDNDSNSSSGVYPYYLLVETHGSSAKHDEEKLEAFLTTVLEGGLVVDGVVAQDESQRAHFWKLRELANPTVGALGYSYKYDLTVPVAEWMDFCEETRRHVRQHLPDTVEWVDAVWGHIVDGNMHYNFVTPQNEDVDPRIEQVLEPFLFEAVLRRGGSVSAEHGVGQAKRQLLPMVHEEASLQTMRDLKDLFDPKGILNPHKVLPS